VIRSVQSSGASWRVGRVARMEEELTQRAAALVAVQVMLLANLTVSPAGVVLMLQQGKGVLEGAAWPAAFAQLRLTRSCAGFHFSFLLHALAAEPGGWAAHAAHVAANVSSLPAGRAVLVAPADGRVALLARALTSPGAASAARWGAATALRNCALDAELHKALLHADSDNASLVVPALLAPLAPAARTAEHSVPLREACADALAALAATETGRAAMWAAGAVEAMRAAYEDEQVPHVCAALETAVRALPVRVCRRVLAHSSHVQADLLITRGKAEAEQMEASEVAAPQACEA